MKFLTMLIYSRLLLAMMTYRNSIQDGMNFLFSMSKIHTEDVLESLYNLRLRESDQLKVVLALYEQEIHQKISKLDYHKLKTMVKRSIDQNLRSRNFEARNGRSEPGAVVKNPRGHRGVERGSGECWQWQAKGERSEGNSCSFRHDESKRVKTTPMPTPSSEPVQEGDERKGSRRRTLRGRSPSVKPSRLPCRKYLRGSCTTPSCSYWHPPDCQKIQNKVGV